MSYLQSILRYQAIDGRLAKLENELAESEERKKYAKLRKFLKAAPEKLDALESKAGSLKAEAAALTKKYEQVEGMLSDFENLDELIGGGADVSFYKKKAQSVMEQLKKIKAEINALAANVKAVDAEYQDLKKKVKAATKQYDEAKKSYEDLEATRASEREEIKKELAAAEKEVDATLLTRYQTKRKEKIFPVVGEVVGGRCPYCSMEFPIAARSKLSAGVECDMCHRIVFGE